MAFPNTGLLDSFAGVNQDPISGNNWSGSSFLAGDTGSLALISNQLTDATGGGTDTSSYFSLTKFGPDCECYITVATASAVTADVVKLLLRGQDPAPASMSGYELHVEKSAGTDIWRIRRRDMLVATQLGADMNQEIASGDAIGFAVVGTTLSAYYKASGGSWTLVGSRDDSTYMVAGYMGVKTNQASARAWKLDDFGGGTTSTFTVPFPVTILDDFNRADNVSLGGNWTEGVNGKGTAAQITSNQVTVPAANSTSSICAYTAGPTGLRLACQMSVTGSTFNSADEYGISFTRTANTAQGYHVEFDTTGTDVVAAIYNDVTNSPLIWTATGFGDLATNDIIGLTIVDDGVACSFEVWIGRSGAWTRIATIIRGGAQYLAGPFYPGFRIKYDTELMDNFGAAVLPDSTVVPRVDSSSRRSSSRRFGPF